MDRQINNKFGSIKSKFLYKSHLYISSSKQYILTALTLYSSKIQKISMIMIEYISKIQSTYI